MSLLKQIKGGASQLFETLEEGWSKFVAKSGQALTRFTRRTDENGSSDDRHDRPEVVESWGLLAGEVATTPSHVIVRLEVPGMDRDDFEVRIENGALRVSGEKRVSSSRGDENYHVYEAAYGAFERVLPLPSAVDADRAEATYERGVLTVRVPRAEGSRARRIRVG